MYKLRFIGNKGITLIALVVTIVVLLILAGISINAITANNGVVNQAQEAKIKTELSSVEEAYNVYLVNSEKTNRDGTDFSKVGFLTKVFIGDDQYVYAVNDLDKLNLDMDSGKGTIETAISKYEDLDDVYFVDEEGHAAYIKDGILYGSVDAKEGLKETDGDFFTFDEATGTITGIVENTSKDPNGIGYYYIKYSEDHENYGGYSSEVNIVIPSQINGVTVKAIGDRAFGAISNVESIVIPDTVETIGEYAFVDNNMKTITLPDSINSIGKGAFLRCRSLTEITIPKNVTTIDYETFRNCTNLTNVILPEGLTTIKSAAFRSCTSLKSIVIPSSVTSIASNGYGAFGSCTNLTSIVLKKGSTLEIPENKWKATNATVTVEQ